MKNVVLLWKCYTNCENVTWIVKNVTRILKILPQYRHQCSIVPKCLPVLLPVDVTIKWYSRKYFFLFVWFFIKSFNATLNNISAISVSEMKVTGFTIENHRPGASNWSTLFNLIEAEKDIDIKVCKLFIHNNNKNHKRIPWRSVLVLEEVGENHRL